MDNEQDHPAARERPRLRDAGPGATGATVGAIVQHVLGDEVSGSFLAPLITTTIRIGQVRERLWWERTAAALTTAADDSAVSLDELEQRALSDPSRAELFARIISAAGRTPLEDKLRALGRVLAAGLDPAGQVDEAFALAAALDNMEAPSTSTTCGEISASCSNPGRLGSGTTSSTAWISSPHSWSAARARRCSWASTRLVAGPRW